MRRRLDDGSTCHPGQAGRLSRSADPDLAYESGRRDFLLRLLGPASALHREGRSSAHGMTSECWGRA